MTSSHTERRRVVPLAFAPLIAVLAGLFTLSAQGRSSHASDAAHVHAITLLRPDSTSRAVGERAGAADDLVLRRVRVPALGDTSCAWVRYQIAPPPA